MGSLVESLGISDLVSDIRRILRKPRKALNQVITTGCIILSAFVLWRCLMTVTNCESPVVVVLSGSMEPGMYRGDVLFLTGADTLHAGDIVVYQVESRGIPIVHRVLSVHEPVEGESWLLTKGDNNRVDDRGLYNEGQNWLRNSDIVGKAVGIAPKVGMVTIWLNDYPALKWGVLGILGFLLLLGKDV